MSHQNGPWWYIDAKSLSFLCFSLCRRGMWCGIRRTPKHERWGPKETNSKMVVVVFVSSLIIFGLWNDWEEQVSATLKTEREVLWVGCWCYNTDHAETWSSVSRLRERWPPILDPPAPRFIRFCLSGNFPRRHVNVGKSPQVPPKFLAENRCSRFWWGSN